MAETVDFTTSLTEADWDAQLGGWRCSALAVPGAAVMSVRLAGAPQNMQRFVQNSGLRVVQWVGDPDERPRTSADTPLTVVVTLTKRLTPLSTPVAVAIIGALATIAASAIPALKNSGTEVSPVVSATRPRVLVQKGAGPVTLDTGDIVELKQVETLKGKREKGVAGAGHALNLRLPDRGYVFQRLIELVAPTPPASPAEVEQMSEEAWEAFLKSQQGTRGERLKEIPFARISLTADGRTSERWYFKNDPLIDIAAGWYVKNIFNTKNASEEPEAILLERR